MKSCPFLSGSDRAQFLNTTSSSQRRFICKNKTENKNLNFGVIAEKFAWKIIQLKIELHELDSRM